jgi:3-hydroxyisobutyrate dehydrogenase-like beta-hydroxyacid dehydrogenase
MNKESLGILHPGEMGVTVALAAQNSGHYVYWVSAGRSTQTRERADKIALIDAESFANLCETCSILICVCPPGAAEDVAGQVAAQGFQGLYIDANAISPQRAQKIALTMQEAGVSFVDGSIIGGPAWKPNTTRLYLSGAHARKAAHCFSAGPLGVNVIGESIGQASALKMCYAAYTKGSTALLCAILAAAEALEVRENLMEEWSLSGSNLAQESTRRVRRVTAKAWRFSDEMEEIAATFKSVGIPDGFHAASANIYTRLSGYKGSEMPEIEDVIATLLKGDLAG